MTGRSDAPWLPGAPLCPDTSVVVPALVRWHEHHERAAQAVAACSALVAHVALETYSVLTALPGGRHLTGDAVRLLLARHFPDRWLVLDGDRHAELVARIAVAGIRGGATYDAMVGATAAANRHRLVSRDRRAWPVYHAVGADVVMLEGP